MIWTEKAREIGVGFDAFHTHFISSSVPSRAQPESVVIEEALRFVDDLLEERLVVISYPGGSTCILQDEIEDEIAEAGPGLSLRIRSWKNTFSRDVQR